MLLLSSALLLALVYQAVVRPLTLLQKSVRQYRQTMDSAATSEGLERVRFVNEVGALAGDFIALMVEIDSNTAEVAQLSAENERIETELSMAASIQANVLPNILFRPVL